MTITSVPTEKQVRGQRKAHLLALPVQVEVAILHYFWLHNWRKFQSFHTISYPLLCSLNSFIFLHVNKIAKQVQYSHKKKKKKHS
jgi:hypothetical protein